jgi:hypothetical protein
LNFSDDDGLDGGAAFELAFDDAEPCCRTSSSIRPNIVCAYQLGSTIDYRVQVIC